MADIDDAAGAAGGEGGSGGEAVFGANLGGGDSSNSGGGEGGDKGGDAGGSGGVQNLGDNGKGEGGDQGGKGGDNSDGSGGGGAEGAGVAPESYADFKMPEGTKLDQAVLDKALPMFKESGLSQDNAQKFIDFYNEQMSGERIQSLVLDAQDQITKSRAEGWAEALQKDATIGGAKYEESAKMANKAMEAFATPELRAFFKESGIGVHPEMVRVFCAIGKAMSEDSFHGGSGGGAGGEGVDRVTKLYGNQSK